MCPRGVCMYVSGKCMYPPTPQKPIIWISPNFFFDPKWLRGGKYVRSLFCHILFLGVSMTVPFPIGGLRGMGYKSLGAWIATYVRARPKFLLKGNSSVSAQYLQNFGPAGHRFLIPYALHSFFFGLFVCWSKG